MSGYDWSSGKSNRAVKAERDGKLPLTRAIPVVAKVAHVRRLVACLALEAVGPTESHHSSKFYNSVDYYSVRAAVDYLTAQSTLATLPADWEERFASPRRLPESPGRFAAIEASDAALAAEWGVSVELLERAYYETWNDE